MGTPMELVHLAARLDLLAAWRTPGAPRPRAYYPAGEHVFLRDAAARLLRMDADLKVMEHLHVAKGEHWRHWCVLNAAGDVVFAASEGPSNAHGHVRDMIELGTAEARNWLVRPIIIGRPT